MALGRYGKYHGLALVLIQLTHYIPSQYLVLWPPHRSVFNIGHSLKTDKLLVAYIFIALSPIIETGIEVVDSLRLISF